MDMIPESKRKRYPGHYPGQVVSVSDPAGMMRVRVRAMPLFKDLPDSALPWAEYLLPVGARPGNGIFVPVKVGDWVWIDFPYQGDSRRPRIVGAMHYCPGGVPNLPHEAFSGPGAHQHERCAFESSPAPVGYHDGAVVVDENGVLLEIGADGSVRATNKASGSAIEICADGSITIHSGGDINMCAAGNIKFVATRIDWN